MVKFIEAENTILIARGQGVGKGKEGIITQGVFQRFAVTMQRLQ